MVAAARGEVTELTDRRNAIAAELGQLSGVIEALAVEEGRPRPTPDGRPTREAEVPAAVRPTDQNGVRTAASTYSRR